MTIFLIAMNILVLFVSIKSRQAYIKQTKKEKSSYKILIKDNDNTRGYITKNGRFLRIKIEDKKYYTEKSCNCCSSKEVNKIGCCANCGISRM